MKWFWCFHGNSINVIFTTMKTISFYRPGLWQWRSVVKWIWPLKNYYMSHKMESCPRHRNVLYSIPDDGHRRSANYNGRHEFRGVPRQTDFRLVPGTNPTRDGGQCQVRQEAAWVHQHPHAWSDQPHEAEWIHGCPSRGRLGFEFYVRQLRLLAASFRFVSKYLMC